MLKFLVCATLMSTAVTLSGCEDDKSAIAQESLASSCIENGGKFLSDYNECEIEDKAWCETNNGIFDGCQSFCRHKSREAPCIMMCVSVCKL